MWMEMSGYSVHIAKQDGNYSILSNNLEKKEKIIPENLNGKLQAMKAVSYDVFTKQLNAAHFSNTGRETGSEEFYMQIIIASTWRSGSTFLEELIESHRGMYNFYEPLLTYGMRNFYNENEPGAQNATSLISNLLKCNYDEEYILKAKKTSLQIFMRNQILWNLCKNEDNKHMLCFQKNFLENTCHLFPLTVMKLVRLGVRLLKPILEDESLNTQVVFLVRDPRAVINSRLSTVDWCNNSSCNDIFLHCAHLEDDLNAVKLFSKMFPGRIHLIRYEDLALNPYNVSKKLFEDLNLNFGSETENYIKIHTTSNVELPDSTQRESSKRVLHWTSKIDSQLMNKPQTKFNLTSLHMFIFHNNKFSRMTYYGMSKM